MGICKPRSTNCSSSLTSCLTAASDANLDAALERPRTAIVLWISLHSCIFLANVGNHSKPPDCSFSRRHVMERPPWPTLGDLRPVPRFTLSSQESADGLLGACDPLCRFLPVSSRQADGANGADEADGAPRCYGVDPTRPARDKRRHALMNDKGMLL